jgi:regulator of sigma E protease
MFVTILQFMGALIALIIIHELGHFVVARLLKVEIEEFGLFFPPRIATLFEAGGTKFTLNAIPLGGFVRPKGENDPEVPGGLAAASPWVRLAVLSAGPIANLVTAAILYAVIFMQMGSPNQEQVLVARVAEQSPAAAAGLQEGDIFVQAGGQEINGFEDLHNVIQTNLGREIELVLERDGQLYTTLLTPRQNPPEGQGAIGIVMGNPSRPVGLVEALPAGFQATYYHSMTIVQLPMRLLSGDVDPEMGRPIGIVGMINIYQEVREGELQPGIPVLTGVLIFFTNISISLGLLNLMPFPALDGGRILFTLPEIILRRRVPPQFENVVHLIGFGLLLLLIIYITVQDVISPVSLPR